MISLIILVAVFLILPFSGMYLWFQQSGLKGLLKPGLITLIWGGVSFFPLMGIPGAGVVYLTGPLLRRLGVDPEQMLSGDKAWPTAILISVAIPTVIPLVTYLGQQLEPQLGTFWKWVFNLVLILLWAVICPYLVHKIGIK